MFNPQNQSTKWLSVGLAVAALLYVAAFYAIFEEPWSTRTVLICLAMGAASLDLVKIVRELHNRGCAYLLVEFLRSLEPNNEELRRKTSKEFDRFELFHKSVAWIMFGFFVLGLFMFYGEATKPGALDKNEALIYCCYLVLTLVFAGRFRARAYNAAKLRPEHQSILTHL